MRKFFTLIFTFIHFISYSQRLTLDTDLSSWTSSGVNAATSSASASTGYTNPVPASGGNHIIFTNCGSIGTVVTLTSPTFDFTGKSGIKIGFGHRKTAAGLPLDIAYSINGGSAVSVGTISGTTTWAFQQIDIPALNGQSNVTFIFSFTTTSSTACSGSSPNNRIDDFATGENMSLPIEYKYFNLIILNDFLYLNWRTLSETNNSHFTIERSTDARNFESIGEIKGAGNSSREISYTFTDEKPLPGINYYRIKQTDYDGQFSYSEIRSVRHKGLSNVSVSPRTTEGRLDITTELEEYTIAIYNAAGQEVKRMLGMSLDQSINIETLHSGVYFVKINGGSESETVRVVKI